jgi:hypothetical protein
MKKNNIVKEQCTASDLKSEVTLNVTVTNWQENVDEVLDVLETVALSTIPKTMHQADVTEDDIDLI